MVQNRIPKLLLEKDDAWFEFADLVRQIQILDFEAAEGTLGHDMYSAGLDDSIETHLAV